MINLGDKLEAADWKNWQVHEHETFNRNWFKFYETKSLCQLNMNKRGMQMQVKEYVYGEHGGYSVCTSAELPNGEWPSFSMSFETMMELDAAIRLILVAWEAMNAELNGDGR